MRLSDLCILHVILMLLFISIFLSISVNIATVQQWRSQGTLSFPDPAWRVGCEGSRREPERSDGERSEAEDRSSTSQTGFRKIWQRSGENKRVA